MNPILSWGKRLASPKIFYYSLFWLMFLLVVGTVRQKWDGLYLCQEIYFSSWFLWDSPLPGGRLTMTVITINLLSKLIFASPWRLKNLGIIITHVGALVLLGGGILTAYFSTEGALVIDEGASNHIFQDYHDHELTIIDHRHEMVDQITAFSGSYLQENALMEAPGLDFTMEVLLYSENVELKPKEGPAGKDEKGMAIRFDIEALQRDPEDVNNRGGIRVHLRGLGAEDGIYNLAEFSEVPQTLANGRYTLGLRKKSYRLPFSIELIDFEKQVHPGTTMARSYRSLVNVVEADGSRRKVDISMNEPLRTRGYTLFQASFSQEGQVETSVLTVVENAGRLFPYISSGIICFGIFIHLVLNLSRYINRRSVA